MTPVTRPPVPDAELLRLDHQVCFSLHAASRAFGGVYRDALKGLGLTYPQYLVMLVLWEHGPQPVKTIGEQLRLDSGTLPRCSNAWSRPVWSAANGAPRTSGRSPSTSPPCGDELREAALPVPRRMLAATGLTIEELRTLQGLLGRVTTALDEA